MNKSLLGSLGLLGLVLVAGCGSDEASGGPGDGAGDCGSVAAAQCEFYLRCLPTALSDMGVPRASCHERLKLFCEMTQLPGTNSGPLIACVNSAFAPERSCAEGFVLASACDSGAGTLKNGEPCQVGSQCQSGGCKILSLDGCGTCMATVGEGESCESQPCDPDLSCAMGKCVRVETSLPPMKGEACDASKTCATFLRCDNGICADLVGEGGACDGSGDCEFHLSCEQQVCSATQPIAEGQPCGGRMRCEEGAYCQLVDGYGADRTCVAIKNDGEACSDGAPCMFPASCENGVCTLFEQTVCK